MTAALTVSELQYAELRIISYVQAQSFKREIATLRSDKVNKRTSYGEVPKTSSVYRLSPVLSAHGLLCVGGRLEHSMLPEKEKHPIILPKKHHVTSLLINHYHMLSGHSGKEFVLSLLRQKYWIIGARQIIRRIKRQCITCRKCFEPPCLIWAEPGEAYQSNSKNVVDSRETTEIER